MTEQMQLIIILFFFAFLIGFFIAHLVRRGAYERKYQDQITTLEEDNEKSTYLLSQAQEKTQNIQSRYTTIHDNLTENQTLLEKSRKEESSLLQSLSALQNEKEVLSEKIKEAEEKLLQIKTEIDHSSEELEEILTLRDILHTQEKEIKTLLSKRKDRQALTQTYISEIEKLKQLRKSLRERANELRKEIVNAKAKLFETTKTLKKIENKYIRKIRNLTNETEDLRITALNYEYALKEYLEKAGEKAKDIEKIVRKNDASRLVDKVLQKLFRKQRITDKEI